MARAIIHNYDMIASMAIRGQGTDIGPIPRGVGTERLRWTGTELVDLAEVSEIYVLPKSGGFELHAVEVPGSQLLEMNYFDRKRLRLENGTVVLDTPEEAREREKTTLFWEMTKLITKRADAALDLYLAEYGEVERTSFIKQLEEAQALSADPEAPTPMLNGMVAARQDPEVPNAAALAQKVLAKDAEFTAISASIVGQRQRKHIALKAARDADDLAAMRSIDLTYQYP